MRHGIQPPAGCRRAGRRPVGFRSKRQGGDAVFLRGKLQPPAGSERHIAQFADHSGNLAAAQAFFHGPQGIAVPTCAHQDQPCGINAELQQRRAVQGACIQRPGALAPQDRGIFRVFRQPSCQQGAESGRDAGIGGEDFVQGAAYQPATGQMFVDFVYPEREHLTVCFGQGAADPFKPLNMRPEPFQACRSPPVSPFLRGKRAVPGASGGPRHTVFHCRC